MGPPLRDCVKNKRQLFEEKLSKKYQAQRTAKEQARNKTKKDKSKKDSSEDETSIAVLLKEIRGDIKEIKADNRDIKNNMQDMNAKILKIENKQKETEEKPTNEFKQIRNEINVNNENLKETIAIKVINKIKPMIPDKAITLNAEDVKKIVVQVLSQRESPPDELLIENYEAETTEDEDARNMKGEPVK